MKVKNPKGSIVHGDGTGVLVEQLLKEFASNAKSRDGNAIRAQLRNHRKALEEIAMVERYTSRYGSRPGSIQESINEDDDDLFSSSRSDYGDHFPSLSEALSAVGGKKAKHGARSKTTQAKPSKRSTQSTLAIATAGQQQVREQHKRQHVPTNLFGKYELELDQVTHTIATNNRDLMTDLSVQDPPTKRSRRTKETTVASVTQPSPPLLFPPGLLIDVQAATQNVAQSPAALQAQSHAMPTIPASNFLIDAIDDNVSDNNDAVPDIMASLLEGSASNGTTIVRIPIDIIDIPVVSHPPVESCDKSNGASGTLPLGTVTATGAGGGGGGDDDSVPASGDFDADNGSNDSQHSHQSDQDSVNDNASQQSYHTCDGNHADLFENCFETVPTALTGYRFVGAHHNGLYGPLPDQFSFTAEDSAPLAPHVDDESLLPDHEQQLDFNKRAQLLYSNWNVMHSFTTLLEIKTWLEQLQKDKHLLLVHLHAAYYNVDATGSITFGQAKKQFWQCLSSLSTFDDGILLAREWPALSVVRIELFLVYPVGHWSRFMAIHTINAADVWDISCDRVPEFEMLDSTVHPSYDVCLASLIALVNACSTIYRSSPNN